MIRATDHRAVLGAAPLPNNVVPLRPGDSDELRSRIDGDLALPAPSDQRRQFETFAKERIKRVIMGPDKAAARYAINVLAAANDLAAQFGLDPPCSLSDDLAIIGLAAVMEPDPTLTD